MAKLKVKTPNHLIQLLPKKGTKDQKIKEALKNGVITKDEASVLNRLKNFLKF